MGSNQYGDPGVGSVARGAHGEHRLHTSRPRSGVGKFAGLAERSPHTNKEPMRLYSPSWAGKHRKHQSVLVIDEPREGGNIAL